MSQPADRDSQKILLQETVSALTDWRKLIDEYIDDPELKENQMGHLKSILTDYCAMDKKLDNSRQAYDEIEGLINESNCNDMDVEKLYKEKMNNLAQGGSNETTHEFWKEVLSGTRDVEEIQNSQSEEASTAVYEELQDSVFYSNVFTPPVDPISKVAIAKPYKSQKCGHVYEYTSIVQYIKTRKGRAVCPYMGCTNNNLMLNELIPDPATKGKIEEYLSQHANDDDEEDSS